MPDYEPIPGFTDLCTKYRTENNSLDCSWNILTTVWEARGMQTLFGNKGVNNLVVKVEHCGIDDESKTFEQEINTIVNRVYKREFTGQPSTFFLSTIRIVCYNKNFLGLLDTIGEVTLGVLDVFLSENHMVPMQWFPVVDPKADLPMEPLGFLKLNCIINTLGERGAVQFRAPDDLADWELKRDPPQILQIPRLNLRKVASRQYNIKISLYQGFDLGINRFTADPRFKVISCCGIVESDAVPNTCRPSWNTLLQVPWYEPSFSDLIVCEVHDVGLQRGKMSHLVLSWKKIVTTPPAQLREPRWIDMFEKKEALKDTQIPILNKSIGALMEKATGGAWRPAENYEAAMVYGGRVLLSIEVERRSEKNEPSPAIIALKPKDCEIWKDPMQKCFFRFQVHFAVSLCAESVFVEFQIGRKSVSTSPVSINDQKLFQFYQCIELECDFPFDDLKSNPMGSGRLSEGQGTWNPEFFVDDLPDLIVKVHKPQMGFSSQLIGFWRGPVKQVLQGTDPNSEWSDQVFVGRNREENGTKGMFQGVEDIMLSPGEELPLPTKRAPWGNEEKEESVKILNPYKGFQLRQLNRDATCDLGLDDFAGFVGFSAKLWLPDRKRCKDIPPKGAPILSCWKPWNSVPFPKPDHEHLDWIAGFEIRLHVYQGRNIPARNPSGVANAFVQLQYAHFPPMRTHTAYLTNNPTWDFTIRLGDLEVMLLPNMNEFGLPSFAGKEMYLTDAEDPSEVADNQAMLIMSPRIEVSLWEEASGTNIFLGRRFFAPEELLTRKTNPEWVSLYCGDPNVLSGELFCSLQVIHCDEKILKAPMEPLVPDKSQVTRADPVNKAPVKALGMIDSKIQVQMLGLRDLTSPHMTGKLYQPFIMVSCDDPKTSTLTKPTSRPSPDNATFMECLEIEIKLPQEREFAPSLEFYVYDSFQGLPFDMPGIEKPIVAYGSMPVGNFYPEEEGGDENLEPPPDEDEQAKQKREAKVKRKKFLELTRTLAQEGKLDNKMRKVLEKFWDKKDEAVKKAFDQYMTSPDPEKFVERVLQYFNIDAGEGGSFANTIKEMMGFGGDKKPAAGKPPPVTKPAADKSKGKELESTSKSVVSKSASKVTKDKAASASGGDKGAASVAGMSVEGSRV